MVRVAGGGKAGGRVIAYRSRAQVEEFRGSRPGLTKEQLAEQFRAIHDAGGRGLLSKCVQYRTSKQYASHWRRWESFMHKYQVDPTEAMLYLEGLDLRMQVSVLIAYVYYCSCTLGLQASTICGGLWGVAHHFRLNLLPTAAFESNTLKAVKGALALEDRKKEESTVRHRKLPFTQNMLMSMVDHLGYKGGMLNHMLATAGVLAFFCLLRSSEYVPDYKGAEENCCHALLAEDVQFELSPPDGSAYFVDASEVCDQMWKDVSLVRFTLRSAKNDKMRMGSVFWFRNLTSLGASLQINVVKVAFDWAVRARLNPDNFFMSYRVGMQHCFVALRYEQISSAIKDTAVRFGFSPGDFGTHSPRVGGACTLRAGGASDSMVKLLARWKSVEMLLVYSQSGMEEFDRMQLILQHGADFSDRDVKLLNAEVRKNKLSHPHKKAVYHGRSVRFV